MSGCGGSTFTGPCQLPARLFRVSKDFCAPEGTTCSVALCAADCAKATLVRDIGTKSTRKRMNLMVCFSLCELPRSSARHVQLYGVIHNYNTIAHVKSFFGLFRLANCPRPTRLTGRARGSFFSTAGRHGDDVDGRGKQLIHFLRSFRTWALFSMNQTPSNTADSLLAEQYRGIDPERALRRNPRRD